MQCFVGGGQCEVKSVLVSGYTIMSIGGPYSTGDTSEVSVMVGRFGLCQFCCFLQLLFMHGFPIDLQCVSVWPPYKNNNSNMSPFRIQCNSSSNRPRSVYRTQCNSSSYRYSYLYRIQCNSSSKSFNWIQYNSMYFNR